jgi:hypothetical protein
VGIAAIVLAMAVAWVLFVPAADWLARHDVGSAHGALLQTARDDARGRLLTLAAGVLAAGALWFTARSFTLSREGQMTDRYTKAIEQLGSDKLDVRIGGIYALERIARDSARDHPVVMEVLTAFIREHSREKWSPQPPQRRAWIARLERFRFGGRFVPARPDVQAAASVIGRRDAEHDVGAIDLHGAHLVNTDLIYADLRGANLVLADLRASVLARARLNRAILSDANFREAFLQGADLWDANLAGADLIGAHLEDADLSGACLRDADLTRADLSDADLTDADLTGADLTGAVLAGAKWPEDKAVPGRWKRDPNAGRLSLDN